MAKTAIGGQIATIDSMGATVTKKLAVDYDGTLPAAGARIAGILVEDADSGQAGSVQVNGIAVGTSGGALTLSAGSVAVSVDTAGKFVAYDSGTKYYALDAAAGADEDVRIVLDAE